MNAKLICKVENSKFENGDGSFPAYYYGASDGQVYVIHC